AHSVLILFLLPDYPDTAHWLTEDEQKLAAYRLKNQGFDSAQMTWGDVKETLTEWRLYAHYLVYFGVSLSFSSLSLFTPSIVAGLGYQSLKANLMTVPPYAVAYVITLITSWSADRYNARGVHAGIACVAAAAGFMASALLPADVYARRYGCLIIASAGVFASIPPLLCWITSNIFTPSTSGLVIALNISFGIPGQIVGVWVYKADEVDKGYPTGHWTNCALLLFAAVGCFGLSGYYRRLNVAVMNKGRERLYRY
ncbi:major facilitator superfamily domain-containing protein, partial [Mycena sanguinolenta]